MSRCPIRYAHQNVIFDHTGRSSAMYRLKTIPYALMPNEQQWDWMLVVCGLLLRGRGDVTIARVNRRYPASDYVPQAADLVNPRFASPDGWVAFLESQVPQVEALDSHLAEVYATVGLGTPTHAPNLVRAVDRAARHTMEAFGIGADRPIMQRDLLEQLGRQDATLHRLSDAMPEVRPITTPELQWYCRRNSTRHVSEPIMDSWWSPDAMVFHHGDKGASFKPMPGDFRQLFHADITREEDHVIVRGEGPRSMVESYQAFLTLGRLPADGPVFPGRLAELMSGPADAVDFPVDSYVSLEWVTNQRALTEVRRRLNHAEDRIQEALKASRTLDNRSLLNPELARDLEQLLMHESRPPMFDGTFIYAIGADSLEELTRRVDVFRDIIPNVTVHRPPGDQDLLYDVCLPHPAYVKTDWAQRLTVDQVAMTMPVAGRELGDRRGVYVAHTVRGRAKTPVKIDPSGDAKKARQNTVYAAGRQGSGKTVNTLHCAACAAEAGAFVYTWDPGGDHHITDLFPGRSAVVELKAQEADRGKLDPLTAVPPELQEEVALSYYLDLLPDTDAAGERELMDAIKKARAAGSGSLGVITILMAGNEIAKELGRSLDLVSDFGLGMLGFGDGTRPQGEDTAQVTTFRMKNLGLPKASTNRTGYDRRQRVAVATFKVAAAHVIGLVTLDPTVEKWVVLDETWVFDGPDGQQMLDSFVRLGRKNNARIVLCSQTVGDLGELKHLIGMYFIYGVADADQAADALDMIGLDRDDESLIGMLTASSFEKGLCLFRDSEKRVDVVQMDPSEHRLAVLNTDPGAERPVPAGIAA
jgi:hypothetical protein